MGKVNPKLRRAARESVLQAVYAWQLSQNPPEKVWEDTLSHVKAEARQFDEAYAYSLFFGITEHQTQLDETFIPYLDRDIIQLDPVELAILRLSTYEFLYCLDLPYKVVINEGLELAKRFGATDGFKFVNGVLDKVAQQHRGTEV